MPTKTVTAGLDGDGLRLIARTGSGHPIVIDDAEGDTGPRQILEGNGVDADRHTNRPEGEPTP